MSVPKRLTTPRRLNASKSTMFPHTVTVYNVSIESDKDTLEDTLVNHITILRGVFYDSAKAVNVRESGLTNADSVNLMIPFGVEAVNGETGEPQAYLPPKEYETAMDKGARWTIQAEDKCFFVKGEIVRPGLSFQQINDSFDNVHKVNSVDEKDFGNLPHWEVGGA